MDLIYRKESYKIMGACFEVYRTMRCGFLEAVYQECLEIELAERRIPFGSQAQLPIMYKGRTLKQFYKADLVCYDKIVLEVKAVSQLVGEHRTQMLDYLRATGLGLGILLNFCARRELEYERIASTRALS